jgi:hypothetical protein
MKATIILTVLIFSAINLLAQVAVDQYGDVSLGNSIFTHRNSGSTVTIELRSTSSDLGFRIDNSGYMSKSTLRPNQDWNGMLGTSSRKWGVAYIDHVLTWNLTNYSDERFKENIKNINGALNKITLLRGVKYDVKDSYYPIIDSLDYSRYINSESDKEKFKYEDKEFKEMLRA